MRQTLTITVYTNRDGLDVKLPSRWVVCPDCDGGGTDRGRHFECDGGGFTASEWAEQDEDFRDDYMSGRLDQPCYTCKGRTTIQIIDEEACTGWRHKIILKAYREQQADNDYIDAMHEAERRFGA
jgi:RecJ-like exonuclease